MLLEPFLLLVLFVLIMLDMFLLSFQVHRTSDNMCAGESHGKLIVEMTTPSMLLLQ
jgi:hypothetical protein